MPLELTVEAREVFAAFYSETRNHKYPTELLAQMGQRLQDQALKLALLYALLEGCAEIHAEQMAAGVEFARWERIAHGRIFEGFAENRQRRLEERILSILRDSGPVMLKRDVQQRIGGKYSAQEFHQAVNALARLGVVGTRGKNDQYIHLIEDHEQRSTNKTRRTAILDPTLSDCW